MSKVYEIPSLTDICQGTVERRFEESVEKILESYKDTRYPTDKKRKITIVIDIEQTDSYTEDLLINAAVNVKLPNMSGVDDIMAISRKDEMNGEQKIDTETGEIL